MNSFRFVAHKGYYCDAYSDQCYIRARAYHPVTARWMSRDPIGPKSGMNAYTYANSRPTVRMDPSGLYEERDCENDLRICLRGAKDLEEACWNDYYAHPDEEKLRRCLNVVTVREDKCYENYLECKWPDLFGRDCDSLRRNCENGARRDYELCLRKGGRSWFCKLKYHLSQSGCNQGYVGCIQGAINREPTTVAAATVAVAVAVPALAPAATRLPFFYFPKCPVPVPVPW